MPIKKGEYTNFILEDQDTIRDFVGPISPEMYEYIDQHQSSKFVLFYKHLTHSDLATFGKATHENSHNKNLLYYMDVDAMLDIEQKTKKPFQTAHQSCIGLMMGLYDLVGLPQPREVDPYLINDYMNVYLVNKNMEYFTSKYTQLVFSKLKKELGSRSRSWDFNNLDVKLSDSEFTPINLHVAVHGLGMEQDSDFHKIRHHLFKGDTILLLFEKDDGSLTAKNMFVFFEKNPIFFNLIGEKNMSFVKYQETLRRQLINKATNRTNAVDEEEAEDEVTRKEQNAWRNMLANEMMAYMQEPRQVFCPLTYITADYDKVGSLFIASHIKGFKDPNTKNEEKFDINNGMLLCANADALFDKHLITIGEDKNIIFSYLIDTDIKLKSQLLLMQPIFQPILNEKRMQYLAYHRSVFEQKEAERKAGTK